ENISPDVEEESIWELSKRFSNGKMLPPSVLTPKTPKPTFGDISAKTGIPPTGST
ncbi:unnamed protein product, partial [marine sediment metagenome]